MKIIIILLCVLWAGIAFAVGERNWGKPGATCVWDVECGEGYGAGSSPGEGTTTPEGSTNKWDEMKWDLPGHVWG
jgi:hypothetical protein